MRPWKGERYVVWYNFALMVFLRPHLVGVNSVNWESGSQLTFPRVGYLSPISTDAVLSTFSIAYFITSHYNSYQPILPLFINRYNVKQSDTLTIARIQTHQILNSFFWFFEPRISLLLPSTPSFQGVVLKAFAINTNGHHNPPVLSPDNQLGILIEETIHKQAIL